ncbi:acyl-CoA thioesterase [Motilibacter deserti]|uniref:acyl-CoA thioesterase n=1 Tax=Motilibacter deserti TaxID=2714956 RepID=UPI002F2B2DFE
MRWRDLDAYQHVNNTAFLGFLEEARISLLRGHEAPSGAGRAGIVVSRHEIDYLAPLSWTPDGIDVEVWVTRLGAVSFHLGYVVRDEERVYARARSVMVAYDLEARGPRRLTAAETQLLGAVLEEED